MAAMEGLVHHPCCGGVVRNSIAAIETTGVSRTARVTAAAAASCRFGGRSVAVWRGGGGGGKRKEAAQCGVMAMAMAERGVGEGTVEGQQQQPRMLLRPTPAEGARTVVEVCAEGTLSTLSEEGWPMGTEVRFAVDTEGNPVLRLQGEALHTQHVHKDSRCSLHVQVSRQFGRMLAWIGEIGKVKT
jgi:hypothetical protein